MRNSGNVFIGMIFLILPINMDAQSLQIQKIIVNFIDMEVDYPFSIDSIMFESMDYQNICIIDTDKLALFQDCLNALVQAEPEYKRLDIRREILVIYSNCNKIKLYADNFHLLFNGTVYNYEGTLRRIIENAVTDE